MGPTSLPPGFRFHPTDEELADYYLKRKVHGQKIELEVIPEVDLYKCEPWDLPGRAPHGSRTNWIMHEYRLDEKECGNSNYLQDAYSLCRVFKRSGPEPRYGKQQEESVDEISNLYNDIYTVPQELSSVKIEDSNQTNSFIPSESSSEMMSDNAVANRWLHFGADETESCSIYQSPNESTSCQPNVEKKTRFEYEHSAAVTSDIEGLTLSESGMLGTCFEQFNPSDAEEEDMVEQIYRDAQLSQKNNYANQLDDFPSVRGLESYEKKPNTPQEHEVSLFPLCIQDLQDDNLVDLFDMEKQPLFF